MYITEPLPEQFMLQGRYCIMHLVGKGGMGRVYKAVDMYNKQRTVAIKELLYGDIPTKEIIKAQDRFLGEATLLQKLTAKPHRYLPTFYDAFSEQERFYLIMDFIEGKTLLELIQDAPNHRLPLDNVLQYAVQLCTVLSDLHQQSPAVIFRDLKPSNIIITPQGNICLIDFGIARRFKADQSMDTELFRSLGYSPPELPWEQSGPQADLYSLGATLHHCLTGCSPTHNKNVYNFAPVSSYQVQVPGALDNLIQKLVATSPDLRPTSAAEVKQELAAIQYFMNAPTEITPPQVSADAHETIRYYNPQLAQEAQFRVNLSRLNKLPGKLGYLWWKMLPVLAKVSAWLLYSAWSKSLLSGQWLGEQVLRILRPIHIKQPQTTPDARVPQDSDLKHNNDQFAPDPVQYRPSLRRKSLNAQASVLSSPVMEEVPTRSLSFWHAAYGRTFLGSLVLIGLSALVVGSAFHLSLLLLVFGLAFCVLVFAFLAGAERKIGRFMQSMLTVIMLAMTMTCAVLCAQPGVGGFLRSITLGYVVAGGLLLLGVASLFRSFEGKNLLGHVVVISSVIVCFFLQMVAAPLEMPNLSPLNLAGLNPFILGLLTVLVILSFIRLGRPFSVWDNGIALVVTAFTVWQILAVGDQAFRVWEGDNVSIAHDITLFFLIALPCLAVLSCYFQQGNWRIIGHFFLCTLLVASATLVLFFTNPLLRSGNCPPLFCTGLFDPEHINMLFVSSLVVFLICLIILIVQRSRFLGGDILILTYITIASILLQSTIPSNALPYGIAQVQGISVLMSSGLLSLVLLLLCGTAFYHLISRKQDIIKTISVIDRVIVFGGYLLLLGATLVCLVVQWSLGGREGLSQVQLTISPPYTYNSLLLVPLGVLTLIAVAKIVRVIHHLLLFLSRESHRDTLGKKAIRVMTGETFHWSDRMILFILGCYLLEMFATMAGPFPTSTPWLRSVISPFSFFIWIIIGCLLVASGAFLAWSRQPSQNSEQAHARLCAYSVLVCGLGAAGSSLIGLPLFWLITVLSGALGFLLWGVALVRWAARQ